MTELPALLSTLLSIADEAAKLVLSIYATPFTVEEKGPNDPVTLADQEANQLICERLGEHFPDAAIVAEESAPESYRNFAAYERIFFVDPLDGTREFVRRSGEFVVMLGCVDGDLATAGVIVAPTSGRAWLGRRGDGAFRRNSAGLIEPISPSTTGELSRACVVASRFHRAPHHTDPLTMLGAREIRPMGSAGLKGSLVAEGAVDAYVAPGRAGMRWDACAPDAIVSAAGGKYSDATGRPIDYRRLELTNDRGVIASNRHLHAEICETLARR